MIYENFGDFIEFLEGPGVRKWQFREKGIKLINIRNIVNSNLLLENTTNCLDEEEVQKKYSHFLLEKGDFVMASSGVTWGKIAEVKEEHLPLCLNTSIIKIKPLDERVSKRYLWHFIKSFKFRRQIDRLITGSAQPNFGPSHLKKVKIPLPPLPEQKRIAALLDEADKVRQLNRQLIEKYEALGESLFLEMFGDPISNPKGWKLYSLIDVAEIIMGQSPKGDSYNNLGKGEPLLNGPTEFRDKHPKEKQWTTKPKKMCKTGDILFCVRGATAGKMNWADKEYCLGRGLAAIRSKGLISKNYIYLILERLYVVFQSTSNGSTFINISRDDLRKVKIPMTSKEFQNQFATRIQLIETQKSQAQAALVQADNLFNSLLQRAFKGEE